MRHERARGVDHGVLGGDAVVPLRLAREVRGRQAERRLHSHEGVEGRAALRIDREAPEGVALVVEPYADSTDAWRGFEDPEPDAAGHQVREDVDQLRFIHLDEGRVAAVPVDDAGEEVAVADVDDAAVAALRCEHDAGLGEVEENEGGGVHGGLREGDGWYTGKCVPRGMNSLYITRKNAVCTVLYDFYKMCFTVPVLRECSSMVEYDLPKVGTRVRFPSLAPRT